ncbi:MAG: MFS transporter [Pirellulaceae bacterium]|nr:MFS transporter [Pirellulaceae bacterium]
MTTAQHEGESGRGGERVTPADSPVSPSPAPPLSPSIAPPAPIKHEFRNFWILVCYQVLLRTGWIFKTESSIMPAAADALDPTGLAKSWLPLLNRFGQSVPPVLASRWLKNLPKKKRAFIGTTASMTLCFLGLTSLWLIPALETSPFTGWLYLLLYAVFFAAIGVNALAYNTIQGKLIRPNRRGRLLMIADTVGAITAVTCALTLLMSWLGERTADYARIFGFTTCLFAAASAMSWFLKEQPDSHHEPPRGVGRLFAAAWQTLREDVNFRRLAIVSALFSTSLILFPHYQALAHGQLKLPLTYLVWWVVAQNVGTGVFSFLTGPLADRFGNRLVLRMLSLCIISAPLLAMVLTWNEAWGQRYFFAVFTLIGMTPVAQKSFNNYTLEISEPAEHPRYLSTLSLCMAAPIFTSPLVGWIIAIAGFEVVYFAVTLLLVAGFVLSLGLSEPRSGGKPIVLADDSLTE